MVGCTDTEQWSIARLALDNVSLRKNSKKNDSCVNVLFDRLILLDSNLRMMDKKESLFAKELSDRKKLFLMQSRLYYEVKDLIDLQNKNKHQFSDLKEIPCSMTFTIKHFDLFMNQLSGKIEEQDHQLTILKTEYQKEATEKMASCTALQDSKEHIQSSVQNKTEQLGTVYFITGTLDELISARIIKKQGDITELSKNAMLADNLSLEKFQKSDIKSMHQITLHGKNPTLVTNHPEGSYKLTEDLQGNNVQLEISDPDMFWSISRYLVVITP